MNTRRVATLDELVSLLELRTVRVNEISGRRRDSFDLEDVPINDGRAELKVSQEIGDDMLIFRCRMDLGTDRAYLAADVSGFFKLAAPIEKPAEEVLDEFAGSEGLPIIYPYLRVIVQQAARQIGVPAPSLQPYWARDFGRLFRQSADDPTETTGRVE